VLRSNGFVVGLVAHHMHHLVRVPETELREALTKSDMADEMRRGFISVDGRQVDVIDASAIVSRVVGSEQGDGA
jgi:chemotaxis signal transduction protein